MRTVLALLLAVALAGCGIPRDPEGTLERVTGGTMVAGAVGAEPWVIVVEGRPVGGVEVRLAEEFARTLDAGVEWVAGSEHELLAALEAGELDLVVGGFDASSPWGTRVSFTRPYLRTFRDMGVSDPAAVGEGRVRLLEVDHVMAVPPGENAWITALERFLSERRDGIGDLLEAEGAE